MAGPGAELVLPDGNEALVLPDGRVCRLITRSDYKTGVLSLQTADQEAELRKDPSYRDASKVAMRSAVASYNRANSSNELEVL